MRILLVNGTVWELIPEIDARFPDVPITDRFAPDFLAQTIQVADDTQVQVGQIYDPESGTFADPPAPEPVAQGEPTLAEQIADQQELAVDHEYRITLLELGVTEDAV